MMQSKQIKRSLSATRARSHALTIYLLSCACLLISCSRTSFAQAVSWPQNVPTSTLPQGTQEPIQLGTLSGTIVTSGSAPVAHPCVEVREMTRMESSVTVCTGLDGAFEVRDMPLGDYEIVVSAGQQQSRQMVRVASRFTTVSVEMPGAVNTPHGGGASVTASQLAVPSKAKHALEKAWHAAGKNELTNARKYIASALAAFPRYADALILSAILDLNENKATVSAAEAEQAVACDNTNGMAYIVLAAAYNAQSHFADAFRSAETGMRFRPDAWQAYFERARAELGNREFERALADAARAEELNAGREPLIHLLEGDALVNLARYREAVVQLQTYLSKDSHGSSADYARKLLTIAQAAAPQHP